MHFLVLYAVFMRFMPYSCNVHAMFVELKCGIKYCWEQNWLWYPDIGQLCFLCTLCIIYATKWQYYDTQIMRKKSSTSRGSAVGRVTACISNLKIGCSILQNVKAGLPSNLYKLIQFLCIFMLAFLSIFKFMPGPQVSTWMQFLMQFTQARMQVLCVYAL